MHLIWREIAGGRADQFEHKLDEFRQGQPNTLIASFVSLMSCLTTGLK